MADSQVIICDEDEDDEEDDRPPLGVLSAEESILLEQLELDFEEDDDPGPVPMLISRDGEEGIRIMTRIRREAVLHGSLPLEMRGCVEDPMKTITKNKDQQNVLETRSDDVDQQTEEEGVEAKKNEEVGQDLYQNSQECPLWPADQSDSPTPCLQPGWGSLLPPALHQKQEKGSVHWRPWTEQKQTDIGKDLH